MVTDGIGRFLYSKSCSFNGEGITIRILVLGLLLAGTIVSCASVPGQGGGYTAGYQETGLASWYGKPFHGRLTASGEIYDMYALTAAHRLMPLGTVVRVTHRENGRSVVVKVNDRGPFIRRRTLDLSYAAAKRLGMIRAGTAPVRVEVVSVPVVSKSGVQKIYTVQVGAFENKKYAEELAGRLGEQYSGVHWVTVRIGRQPVYRVRVGVFTDKNLAVRQARELSSEHNLETFVTRKDY